MSIISKIKLPNGSIYDVKDSNQKVKAGNVTFGDDDEVNIVAGNNVTVTGTNSGNTKQISISATVPDISGKEDVSNKVTSWEAHLTDNNYPTANLVKDSLDRKINEPASEGTSGQVLTTDGNGGRSWTTVSGGGGGIACTYYIY